MQGNPAPLLSVKASLTLSDFEFSVDQEIALSGVTGLFGPSGSGKSTLLRVIAGLETAAAGSVHFDQECWQDSSRGLFVPTHRRPVGYVFQDGHLFSRRNVEGNLRFASERSTSGDGSIGYEEVVSTFELQSLLKRSTDALSGGERQRVALARTLLTQPRLLLLDEPLASLDAGRKGDILPYLEALPERFGIPAIYVSHSIDEIVRLADGVVVLENGRVRAAGDAVKVLNQLDMQSPTSAFDLVTILETAVIRHLPEEQLTQLDHRGQTIAVPLIAGREVRSKVHLHVRAGDVALAIKKPEGISFRNILGGTVHGTTAESGGAFVTVSIDIDGAIVRARLTRQAVHDLGLQPGMPVFALLKTASFDRRGV
jgi:molybdate transport system ATP-binding protein